ncbi:MAG: class I SAM-dependent methyltransferase [Planctomycetota bacterium]
MSASPFDRPDLYDALLDDLGFDIPFWLQFAHEGQGPVLEVGCGTGRILVRLLEAGLDVDGVDSSAPMLEYARGKVAQLGHRSSLTLASMDDFTLPRRYRRVICAFNSFAHNLTTRAQLATLVRCREHLDPGGEFGLHLSFPRPELWTGPADRVLEHEAPHPSGDGMLRIYDTRTFDPVQQTQVSDMDIEHIDAAGRLRESVRSHTELRWIYKNELELLLERAGFSRFEIHGDFDRSPLTRDSHSLLAIASR